MQVACFSSWISLAPFLLVVFCCQSGVNLKVVKMPRKKAVNGYKMPEALPKGEVLQDVAKKQWRLGPSIGKGGFGEIYSAQEADKASSKYPFVIKIEPHGNGPLFVERNFYLRNAKPADIDKFREEHRLSSFGMPAFWGSGSHDYNDEKYRFVVMEKFGTDIDKLFEEHNRSFSTGTVFKLALQMSYVLEYIHQTGYIHADLKGANILMGTGETNKHQAYLVDFGLATKFTTEKVFKPNPKKAHDGTIEYLSRDAHKGVPTRRGDFEILAYNIVHWLGGKLPWLNNLKDPNSVQASKEECMGNISKFLKDAFGSKNPPDSLVKFLKYVNSMSFNDEPDYKKIRKIFTEAIEACGEKNDDKLAFTNDRKSPTKRKKIEKTESTDEKKPKLKEVAEKKVDKSSKRKKEETKKKSNDVNGEEILTAEMKKVLEKKQQKLAEKKVKKPKKEEDKKMEDLAGYNDEMKEIHAKKTEKKNKKTVLNEIPSTSHVNNGRTMRNLPKVDYTDY